METTPLIKLSIVLSERTNDFLRVAATICNLSRHILFIVRSGPTSFEIRDDVGKRTWGFLGSGGGDPTFKKRIDPLVEASWETILPLNRDFELARYEGFCALSSGQHTIQLHCYIDWVVSIGVYSEPERSAILSDFLIPSVDSNIIEFQ